MAEKPKDKKDEKKKSHHSSGGMSFGMEVLLFVVAVFILWILTGGAKSTTEQKPFITPLNDPNNPGATYGPSDTKN